MKKKLSILKIIAVCVFLLTMFVSSVPVSANIYNYDSYCIMDQDDNWYVPIPSPFITEETILYIDGLDGQLQNPTDLFITDDNKIYILDSGKSRVVVLDENGKLINSFTGEYGEYNTQEIDEITIELDERIAQGDKDAVYEKSILPFKKIMPLSSPEGIYVDKDGDMFICDTNNQRIVHLGPDGKYVESFYQPQADTYDTEYTFKPSKIYIDEVGRIYIINYMDFHGIITIDSENKFLGYIGATKIEVDMFEEFTNLFRTQAQKDQQVRKVPAYFSNFVINKYDGLTYVVSYYDKKQQIKILTPSGSNVYADSVFGEIDMEETDVNLVFPRFVDVAVDKNGIIYAADKRSSMIYVYDQEGNNLAVFGGEGQYKGTFGSISSMAVSDNGDLVILDSQMGSVQIMRPTDFMNKVINATALFNDGKYEDALGPWEEVLDMHTTYGMAIRGISKAKYRQMDYKEAMRLSEIADDPKGYSEAFSDYRLDIFREYFTWIVLIIIALIIALFFFIKFLNKVSRKCEDRIDYSKDRFGVRLFLDTFLLILFHPIDGLNKLKANRQRYKIYHMLILVLLIVIVRIAYIYIVHYPLAYTLPQYTNFGREMTILFVPIVSWIIVNYMLTSISEGKTTMREVIISTLYSFTPYIVLSLPVALLSHVMGANESGLYNSLYSFLFIWSILLVLLCTLNLNEYSFGKLIVTIIKVIFGTACLFMIVGLFYIIVVQFITFVKEINVELVFMFR